MTSTSRQWSVRIKEEEILIDVPKDCKDDEKFISKHFNLSDLEKINVIGDNKARIENISQAEAEYIAKRENVKFDISSNIHNERALELISLIMYSDFFYVSWDLLNKITNPNCMYIIWRKSRSIHYNDVLFEDYKKFIDTLLKSSKFNINASNNNSIVLLDEAKNEKQVEYLLKHGANPNYKSSYDYSSFNRFHNVESVKLLLAAGADPEGNPKCSQHPLIVANNESFPLILSAIAKKKNISESDYITQLLECKPFLFKDFPSSIKEDLDIAKIAITQIGSAYFALNSDMQNDEKIQDIFMTHVPNYSHRHSYDVLKFPKRIQDFFVRSYKSNEKLRDNCEITRQVSKLDVTLLRLQSEKLKNTKPHANNCCRINGLETRRYFCFEIRDRIERFGID